MDLVHLWSCTCADTGGASKTRGHSHDLGDLGHAVGPLQRHGCVREEKGTPMCQRTARCKSGERGKNSFQNNFSTNHFLFRLNQNARWPRGRGSRVWCQQWLTLRARCRTKRWSFWTRCCSARSSCTLPTTTQTPVRDLPGTWWVCSVTSVGISGQTSCF